MSVFRSKPPVHYVKGGTMLKQSTGEGTNFLKALNQVVPLKATKLEDSYLDHNPRSLGVKNQYIKSCPRTYRNMNLTQSMFSLHGVFTAILFPLSISIFEVETVNKFQLKRAHIVL